MKWFLHNFLLNFVKVTGYLPMLFYLKPRILYESRKNRRPKESEIVIANHTSMFDFVMFLFIYKFRVVRVFMQEGLFKNPLSAWFMKKIGGIRVNRKSSTDKEYMEEAKRTLSQGGVVGIFPESRLNPLGKDFGELIPFSMGSAYLALATGAKIRPVYLHTTPGFFRSSCALVGNLIDLRQMFGSDPTPEALKEANDYLKKHIEKMRAEVKMRKKHSEGSLLTKYIRWSIRISLGIAFGARYHYIDKNVQDRNLKKNVIIVSNHSAVYDPPMLCAAFPNDSVHILACETLYKSKALSWLLDRLGCIKIDRNQLDMDSFHTIEDALSNGRSVGIFPEGAMFEDNEIHEFKSSFVLSAMVAGVDVLPVYIGGRYRFFRRKLHILIDTPMTVSANPPTPEGVSAEAERVKKRMTELKEILNKELDKNV